MKKIIFVLTLLIFTLVVYPVRAEDENDTRSVLKDKIKAKVEEVKSNVVEKKETRTVNRQERRETRAENHAERLSNRFGIYYDRLTKIISKIEERILLIKERGKDVTTLEDKLSEAQSKLEESKKLGEESIALFNSIESENYEVQKEVVLEARDGANLARKSFMEVSKLIREIVKLAKSL